MSQDTKREDPRAQKDAQQSQDALRHRQDAAHHKVRKGPQADDSDVNQGEAGLQPEIPKVGSRDAPGG